MRYRKEVNSSRIQLIGTVIKTAEKHYYLRSETPTLDSCPSARLMSEQEHFGSTVRNLEQAVITVMIPTSVYLLRR